MEKRICGLKKIEQEKEYCMNCGTKVTLAMDRCPFCFMCLNDCG